jgi:hypothetical protein
VLTKKFTKKKKQYFLVQLLTAVTFIDNLVASSVSMDPREFAANLKARVFLFFLYLCGVLTREILLPRSKLRFFFVIFFIDTLRRPYPRECAVMIKAQVLPTP